MECSDECGWCGLSTGAGNLTYSHIMKNKLITFSNYKVLNLIYYDQAYSNGYYPKVLNTVQINFKRSENAPLLSKYVLE